MLIASCQSRGSKPPSARLMVVCFRNT